MLPLVEPLPPCPGCAADGPEPLHVVVNRKTKVIESPFYAVVGCRTCGLVYTVPRPTPEALAELYDGEHDHGWKRGSAVPAEGMAKKREAARSLLAPVLAAPGHALDVGCGAGAILDVLQDAGWQTDGIEPNPIGTVAAARHRLIAEVPAEARYDLIVLHHVLEHIASPRDTLRQLWHASRDGGNLIVSVPAYESLPETGSWSYACGPIHLNGFTRPALGNVLGLAGWRVVETLPAQSHRHAVLAVHDAPRPAFANALHTAKDALREYGRHLDLSGAFVPPATA